MKANELMIGDWVRNDLGEIQQVIELREDVAMLAYNDMYSYDEIDPIPLTPEILEKNGFEFNGTKDWVFGQNQYGNINAFEIRVTPPQPNGEIVAIKSK